MFEGMVFLVRSLQYTTYVTLGKSLNCHFSPVKGNNAGVFGVVSIKWDYIEIIYVYKLRNDSNFNPYKQIK